MTSGTRPPDRQQRSFPPTPDSAGRARRWAEAHLTAWHLDALVDDALLVLSELIANAGLHGRGQIVVALALLPDGLRIEVCDEGDGTVLIVEGPVDRPSGRGMVIVDRLSDRWGVDAADDGTAVWAELHGVSGA
jgi:anti-sigma regulatory factor (Ser/Thr protein kinase)